MQKGGKTKGFFAFFMFSCDFSSFSLLFSSKWGNFAR